MEDNRVDILVTRDEFGYGIHNCTELYGNLLFKISVDCKSKYKRGLRVNLLNSEMTANNNTLPAPIAVLNLNKFLLGVCAVGFTMDFYDLLK